MPHELQSIEEVTDDLLERTFVVYRKSLGDMIKYKFRTKKTLFTLKIETASSSELRNEIEGSGHPIEIIDV